MKKSILLIVLILVLSGWFNTISFAATQQIKINCDVSESLTKELIISASSEFSINWGDGVTENLSAGTDIEKKHTYSGTSARQIIITGASIEGLKATYNEITSIDLSGISTLTNIDISGNKISSLSTLSSNTGLVELRCRNNYLTDVSVGSFRNLKILDCSNNTLTSFVVPSTIRELYVEGTGIDETFDASSYSLLEVLNCSRNDIESLKISQNTNLIELYCSENKISSLNLTSNSKLEKLNCSNNSISSLILNSNLKEAIVTSNSDLTTLSIGSLELLVVDNSVTLSGSASRTIKVNVTGNGSITANTEIIYLFPNLNCEVNSILLNGVEQTTINNSINIAGCTGMNVVNIAFTSQEELVLSETMNKPELLEGMIPVKHNGENWVITNKEDPEWYNYSKNNMRWANVMLRDGAKYLGYDGVTLVSITDSTELKDIIGREVTSTNTGSMYVWIPRFSYKIGESTIDIKYSSGLFDDTTDGYLVHPAFNYANYMGKTASDKNNYKNGITDSDKLEGLWIAKYPAKGTINSPKYYAGGTEITTETIGNAFLASKKNSPIDGNSHMMKNTEWGAISYFTTAIGSIGNNSTTGNIYGIYDMDSGAEYVSHYVELIGGISNYSVRKNGINLLPYSVVNLGYAENEVSNIKDIEILRITNPEDSSQNNYQDLSEFYGVGINEVNSAITGGILGEIPSGEKAFFLRGTDGIFSYDGTDGGASSDAGFRNVLLPTSYEKEDNLESFYVISKSEGNGKVSPLGKTTVIKGDSITFSIIPENGYEILDVKLDDVSVMGNVINYGTYSIYTISSINANHTLHVQFAKKISSYTVSVTKNISEAGTVIGAGTYNSRTTVTLTATANTGYIFANWEVIGGGVTLSNTSSATTTFVMPDNNVQIKANFNKITQVKLTVINAGTTTTEYKNVGDSIVINAATVTNHNFVGWTAEGINLSSEILANPRLQFTMPPNDVTVESNYHQGEYTISYNVNGGVGEIPSQTKKEYVNLILTDKKPTKALCEFLGWATTYDATEAEYQPLDTFTKDENTTLYAVWREKEVTLTIETNESIVYGDEFCGTYVLIRAKVVDGFIFNSWTSAGITVTDPNSVVEILEEDVTVKLNYSAQ